MSKIKRAKRIRQDRIETTNAPVEQKQARRDYQEKVAKPLRQARVAKNQGRAHTRAEKRNAK